MVKHKWMMYGYVAVGAAGFVAGRMLKQDAIRSAVKAGMRGGLKTKQAFERTIAEVREDLEDIAAEAAAEIAKDEPAPTSDQAQAAAGEADAEPQGSGSAANEDPAST